MLWVIYEGPITMDDVNWVLGVFREAASQQRVFAAIDVSRSSFGAEARKLLIDRCRLEWFRGAAFLRANLIQRTLARAIVFSLFYGREEGQGRFVTFLPDEEAARAWFAERRQEGACSPSPVDRAGAFRRRDSRW